MPVIHPSAIVEDGAVLADDVEIGAYAYVGAHVSLADGVRLHHHASIVGHTSIGARTTVFPFASLGTPPQSVHYKGEPGRLTIGADCQIREHVTVNIGTAGGGMETTIGERCFLMVGSHVAHDCHVGNNVIFANNATLGGHVVVGDFVFFGGLAAVHQFVRIGEQAMIGGVCPIRHDVIPFGAVRDGADGLGGLNIIGLKRRGFDRPTIHALRAAYKAIFYGSGSLDDRVERAAERFADNAPVMRVVEFIRTAGKRQITVPSHVETDDGDDD
ncbi:acyl-ACP--UDP-N-acetylglucosamine O-acyltransferase [Prosthecomicrobium pneumaticum]|uniref:Acyl-[acyl-carrier-protein]--UDP-N-acetylglucosamine O-acyltransferase n=1 Tax=Prosthecomicrobium pneumaticum TaxID=81895 RepID=A0A7W9CTL9_9HYPH|nr:acyl-ACP--UDP-N-acetylglucosamine O-acyltransferase [Prosthecomicrobium pneumaticum]MBB5751311.1 UDP-N-acetylglucosamine acyltransferase [Prosthecomicrobium pneumaticum]